MDPHFVVRVREAIADSGLTQEQVARDIGLSPDKLSKSLNEKRRLTSFEVALIAQLTGKTVDWLLAGTEIESPSVAARVSVNDGVDSRSALDFCERMRVADDQLKRLGRSRRLPSLPVFKQSERMASWASSQLDRHEISLDGLDNASLVDAIEDVFAVDVAITRDLPQGMDGCAWQTSDTRLMVVAATAYWARQRFTIAHELGHVLFGDAHDLIAEEVRSSDEAEHETRASRFAASFLMPEALLRKELGAEPNREAFAALSARLSVSPKALSWRSLNLGLISRNQQASWGDLTAEQCALVAREWDYVGRARAVSEAERLPMRLVAEHLQALWDGETSARPLAQLLGVSLDEVADLFPTRHLE